MQAEGASLDLALEQGGFRDFEQELDAFEALLLRDRVRVDRRLSWLQAAVPWLLALPLLLATLIFIVFRRYLRRAVAEPLADIMTSEPDVFSVTKSAIAGADKAPHAITSAAESKVLRIVFSPLGL